MADNRESSHADELLNMLQNFRDDTPPKSEPVSELDEKPESVEETVEYDETDEVLEILAAGLAARNGETVPAEEVPEESAEQEDPAVTDISDIPVSIFGHLSDESNIQSERIPGGEGTRNLHFTDDAGDVPPLPEEEEETEAEEEETEEEEKEAAILKVGSIFQKISVVPKAVIYILVVVLVSVYLSYYVITIGNDVFALVTDNREVTVTIEEGMDHKAVAELLEEKGIIEYGWVYELYMSYHDDGDSETVYVPGEYTLNTADNYSMIIYKITLQTAERSVVRITIPEGYTVDQVIDLLLENGIGTKEGYVEAINNYPYKWDFVEQLDEMGYSEHRKYRLEGYLYPDTYDFYNTEDEVHVINKMLAAFNNKFWLEFNREGLNGTSYRSVMEEKYGMTFDDVIVFASMLQAEGGTAEDFYYISHVFHNRLQSTNMKKLESDATLQYILPERIQDPALLKQELDNNENPYNSYKYEGLPPGAICNPGLDALSAAQYPESPKLDKNGKEIKCYYFVSNDAGVTYYATNLSEHEKNKKQVEKDNKAMDDGTYIKPEDEPGETDEG